MDTFGIEVKCYLNAVQRDDVSKYERDEIFNFTFMRNTIYQLDAYHVRFLYFTAND